MIAHMRSMYKILQREKKSSLPRAQRCRAVERERRANGSSTCGAMTSELCLAADNVGILRLAERLVRLAGRVEHEERIGHLGEVDAFAAELHLCTGVAQSEPLGARCGGGDERAGGRVLRCLKVPVSSIAGKMRKKMGTA